MGKSTPQKFLRLSILLLLLGLTGALQAQTVTYSCTAKDLYADKVYFDGWTDLCNPPADGTIFTVKLRIINKTNSTRNAAAFWGKLIKIDKFGNQSTLADYTGSKYYCFGTDKVPALQPNGSAEFAIATDVAFEEGARYLLQEIMLAWTNASKNASCNTIAADFGSSISPKCAILESLEVPVNIVPNATIIESADCYNGGKAKIQVTPTGGKPKYQIELKADSSGYRLIGSASGVTTFTFNNVSVGNYLVIVTDQTPCKDTQKVVVSVTGKLPAPSVRKVDEPSICGKPTGTMAINSPNGSYNYFVIVNGSATAVTNTDSIPVAGGSKPRFIYTNGVCGSDTTSFCPESFALNTVLTQKSKTSTGTNLLGTGTIESPVTIKTMPNPFGNRVTFMINVAEAGQGTLEVFNIQGQKVKTLYQGYMAAGMNTYELTVSNKRQGELIYVLTKDGVKTSGKLLQTGKQ